METLLTVKDIELSLLETLNENKDEILKKDYPMDLVNEYVDGEIPIYHSQLIDLAQHEIWLAVDEPELYAFDGKHTAVNAIAGNLYQHLQEIGMQWLEENDPVKEIVE